MKFSNFPQIKQSAYDNFNKFNAANLKLYPNETSTILLPQKEIRILRMFSPDFIPDSSGAGREK